jgi:hypothetical protein
MLQITSEGLKHVFSLTQLQQLKMSLCPISDEEFTQIVTTNPMMQLTHLDISEFSSLK